jgi:glycosyltransferase involved in cell wall biosynthesis
VRVGLVVYGPLDRRSGGYLYDRELADRLEAAGDDVEVVSLPERSYPAATLSNLSRGLRRRLERAEFDVLLQDELCHPSLALLNRRLEVDYPVVSVVHHLASEEPRTPWRNRVVGGLERAFLRTVDAHVCTNRTTRDAVLTLAEGRSVVARPGGNRFGGAVPAEYVRARSHRGPLRVLFVGNVTPRKGLDTLVEGLARVRAEWELTVVGDVDVAPSHVAAVRERVADLGVGDRVTFAGRLPDPDLAAQYARSHLLAVPSAYEGYGIVYVEGMGFGLPAVASAAGGASEVVHDRHNGRLVPPGDASAVCDVVAPLCRDRTRLAEMGLSARRSYLEHPTWDDTAERVRAFLADLT